MFLGIDGGQSHTEAVVADVSGRVLGRGRGGASNHAEQPGGRERLRHAIVDSTNNALASFSERRIETCEFAAAHCAMTGGADFKREVIEQVLHARVLHVAHDAPAALAGATGGRAGIVVIAGTGSVAYAENRHGESTTLGGWGHICGDEGSGYWIALEGVRACVKASDGLADETRLTPLALEHFACADLRRLALAIYAEEISRDCLASFAQSVARAASDGDAVARRITNQAARYLARLACACFRRIGLSREDARIAIVGGVFRSNLIRENFVAEVGAQCSQASVITPHFDPAIGALLLGFRAAKIDCTLDMLKNLEEPHNFGRGLKRRENT